VISDLNHTRRQPSTNSGRSFNREAMVPSVHAAIFIPIRERVNRIFHGLHWWSTGSKIPVCRGFL